MRKFFIVILMLFFVGCDETSLDQINQFSGRWVIAFKTGDGNVLREGEFTLQDNGNVCNKVLMTVINDSVYFEGNVNSQGLFTGKFSDSCGVGTTGSVSGSMTEILGIITGTGSWNDTVRTRGAIGTWEARRL